tara:strand:- start:1653 stop:2765 length:1113 start_codon:yes stop_codon:yes gene_type:complete
MANEWARGTATLIPNVAPNHTIANAINAIGSFLVATGWELASWSGSANDRYYLRTDRNTQARWRYEGDGPVQHCGIHVYAANSDTEVRLSTFLQDSGATAVQVDTADAPFSTNRRGYATLSFDATAPNNYLMVGGEDGFYIEAGRDGEPTNLGHAWIVAFAADPNLNGTKDAQVRWMAQGMPLDLFGACRFTSSLNDRFVIQDGTNRNFSTHFVGYVARGSTNVNSPSPSDYASLIFGNRDLILGQTGTSGSADINVACSFGTINSPIEGRYRISPVLALQERDYVDMAVSSSSASTSVDPSGSPLVTFRDIRRDRLLLRMVVCDYTLLPFVNVVDSETGVTYRVVQFADNGRTANLGIVWPASVVTPTV